MSARFLSRQIQVTVEGEVRQPVSFLLEGKEYAISEILDAWADHGFGNAPPKGKRWWQRHHRNDYRVCTTEGEVFEIYYDRGVSLKNTKYRKWYVSRQLDTPQSKPQSATPGTGDSR
jgi:hypothetical protein